MTRPIPYEVMHNHTTADAPQTVRHVRNQFRELELTGIHCATNQPMYKGSRTSMWKLIPQKGVPPTRKMRYCCAVLKESGGRGRMITTGVRWAESSRRRQTRGIYEKLSRDPSKKIILNNDNDDTRQLFENCRLKAKRVCNPIIDWTDYQVWDFLRSYHIELNPLYDCGFKRVGCIGCPMAGRLRYFEFRMFPKYKLMYRHAFARMVEAKKAAGKLGESKSWATPEGVWHWWMEEDVDQVRLFDDAQEVIL